MIGYMFRTRDFVLLFVTIVFLVMAISASLFKNQIKSDSPDSQIMFVNSSEEEYSAETFLPEGLARETKLAEMKRKIAESGGVSISAPIDEEVEEDMADEVVEEEPKGELMNCPSYTVYTGFWSPDGIKFEVAEGARLVYRDIVTTSKPPADTATMSSSTSPVINRLVLVELPVYPAPSRSCIPSDVVGIANDGSLIRNSEAGLYGVFGPQTQIGYALDGYPIYGTSNSVQDECGGENVGGQYGYYLSSERETVLNCFTGKPTSI